VEKCILVLNAGSSSLKFSLFALPAAAAMRAVAVGQIEGLGTAPRLKVKDGAGERMVDEPWDNSEVASHAQALQRIAGLLRTRFQDHVLAGVGHRVVHGGPDYSAPLLVTPAAMARLETFMPLAPLHQPHNLAPIRARARARTDADAGRVLRHGLPLHAETQSRRRSTAARAHTTERGVRRYGFHGLSYEYVAATACRQLDARSAAHRRARISATARASARSTTDAASASSMGFTALDGLPMGTRPAAASTPACCSS
jgi:acetate kinase